MTISLELPFIMIGSSYGGRQQWLQQHGYATRFGADRSCGPTVGANIAYCLAINDLSKRALCGEEPLTEAHYTEVLYAIYGYMRPKWYGVPSLRHFTRGMQRYAASKGIALKPVLPKSWDKMALVQHIQSGLEAGCPVALVTWNSKIKDFHNHWITITGLHIVGDVITIITSNWGERRTYDFNAWYSARSLYQKVVYFE